MRIRSEQIILFLIISVIPLSSVVHISYEQSKEAIRDSVMDNLQLATENTGLAIDNWMNERKDDIRVISQSRMAVNTDIEQFHEYMRSIESEYQGIYKEFFLLDMDGNIVFSTLNRTGNAYNEQYFKDAANGELHTSEVSFSEISGSPEIMISSPVRKNDTISGILAAKVSLENLYRMIDKIDIGNSGEVFIVNRKGDIIFHQNRSKVLVENIRNNLAVREVTYEQNGINEYVNYNGEEVLGSYYWLPLYRWGLIVEKNRDEAYAQVLALRQVTTGVSIIAVLIVVILAVVLSKRLTKPIESLKDGAHGLVRGEFKPILVSSKNEIGELTGIFNQTAQELLDARKKLETKIEAANKDLENKNKELIIANEELKKIDRMKSDFISLVSHELKTPLSAIRTSAEFLESEETVDPYVEKEMLSNIIQSIDRQTRLINDILDLSKIEAGKMDFQFEQVDIHEAATIALENIRRPASKKNITISVDIPGKLSPALADREKLIIVLNNLLSNALKFTQDNGSILLSATEDKDGIEIRVKDTGIGIEREKTVKIFDKFYQVDGTSRRKIGGSGLGLSISSGIIRAHGSEIYVESEPGKGSTFSFRLKKPDEI